MTLTQAEIIIQFANNSMNVANTAKAMFMHRNNISYHIRQIRRKTGKNPMDFFELTELLSVAKAVIEKEV